MFYSHITNLKSSPKSVINIKRNQLQWILLLRLILYSILIAFNYFLRDSSNEVITLPPSFVLPFLIILYFSTIYSAILLNKQNKCFNNFALFQSFLDTCFAAFLIYFTGCSLSIYTSVFFFPIIAGGLILPNPQSLVPAAMSTILYGAILTLETFQIAPLYLKAIPAFSENSFFYNVYRFSIRGLTFFLAAFLTILFTLRIHQTETALSDSLKDFNNLTELYRQIFNNISTGIITIDPKFNISYANQASENILGISTKHLIKQKITDLFPDITFSSENKRQVLSYHHPEHKELRIGYSYVLLPRSDEELTDNDDNNSHKIITLQDITDVEILEAQVRQAEKLAAIGTMSASIAHDFRNPLTAINGSAQILINEIANSKMDQSNYELCNIILRESSKLTGIISDFLKFSRPETVKCSWFSLQNCIDEVIEVRKASPDWRTSCEIQTDIPRNLDIWADQNQLFVILDHLIDNALPFCPRNQEHITILAQETVEDEVPYIEIVFRDNGTGIPEEQQKKILEPFYTTRADGTGLGLSIIKQNMTGHKGILRVGNAEGGGAEFRLLFPLPD